MFDILLFIVKRCAPEERFRFNNYPIITYGLRYTLSVNFDYIERDFGNFDQCTNVYNDITDININNNVIDTMKHVIISVADFVCYRM